MHAGDTSQMFCERVNAALDQGLSIAQVVADMALECRKQGGNEEAIRRLFRTYELANEPETFLEQRVTGLNDRFRQAYALLSATFSQAELDSHERFQEMLEALQQPDHDHPLILIGRYWRVPGPQHYDMAGQLVRFGYDPMSVTECITSVISGNYMTLQMPSSDGSEQARPGVLEHLRHRWRRSTPPPIGIGAIGHLVTRERFRRTHHHGTSALIAFEERAQRIAAARGEVLTLLILEAQTDSQGFWYKNGFRWPIGTSYAQPPLDFDRETGERKYDEVPETLMVKLLTDDPDSGIRKDLLAQAVYTMYMNWCLERVQGYSPQAALRAREYVIDNVYRKFLTSLPRDEEVIPLGPPPALVPPLVAEHVQPS